jgi:hypothetical protein
VTAATLLLACVLAAEPPQTPLERYRAEELVFRISSGWGGSLQILKDGVEADPGFFGEDADAVFGSSPRGLESMETFRTLRISGLTMSALGIATLLTELVLSVAAQDELVDPDGIEGRPRPLFWVLLIGGTVLGTSGSVLIGLSNRHLSDAVQHYNDDLYERLKPASLGQTSP